MSSTHRHEQVGGTWVKTAWDTGPQASERIWREHRVYTLLGVHHRFDPGPPAVLKTPVMGRPLPMIKWAPSLLPELADVIAEYASTKVSPSLLPPVTKRVQQVRDIVSYRLPEGRVRSWCEDVLEECADDVPAALRASTLCHTDVSPHNLLLNDTGRLVLIDWESARCGTPDFDWASVMQSAWLDGQSAMAERVWEYADDEHVLYWALRLKVASGVSWEAWKHGEPAGLHRLRSMAPKVWPGRMRWV